MNRAEHNGLDSRRLLIQLRYSASMRGALDRADIITLTIGHNDTPWNETKDPCDGSTTDDDRAAVNWQLYTGACTATVAESVAANVTDILHEIRHLRADKPTLIRVTNFHNDNYLDPTVSPVAYGPTKFVVDAFCAAICGAAAKAELLCADIYHALNGPEGSQYDGPYVSEDHVHLNQRDHALIAKVLVRLGYAPLGR